MKGRTQKISQDSYRQNDRAEPEDYVGVQTSMWITENNLTSLGQSKYGLLEQILSPANLNAAYKRVKQNKGAGGVDEMEVESLKDYLIDQKEALLAALLDGKYRPNPVRLFWKQWKKVQTKMRNLVKLGIDRSKAWEYANSRKGYWRLANSWILATSVTNARLKDAGYLFLTDSYVKARRLN